MELKPQDLGTKWHVALVRYRALGTARIHTPPEAGRLGQRWARGLGLSDDVKAATLPMIADTSGPLVNGVGVGIGLAATLILVGFQPPIEGALATLTAASAGLYGCLYALPRARFRRLHEMPVRGDEIEVLKGRERKPGEGKLNLATKPLVRMFQSIRGAGAKPREEELERAFLGMVQDALALRGLSATAEAEVRRVIRSLGDALGAVPAFAGDGEDVADVLGDAEMLAARAARESDGVVAESLLRQADANVARARALENSRRLARRTRVLRDELLAQVKAVRAVLPALSGEGPSAATDFSRFASLAASVQSVASEASSVADAREEVAQTLRPYRFSTEPDTQSARLTAGRG